MSNPTDRKAIISWADLIRAVAIFLVVMIHVSGQLTNPWGEIPTAQWIIADIYGGIARIAVPLFFMISGYLLLPRSENSGRFLHQTDGKGPDPICSLVTDLPGLVLRQPRRRLQAEFCLGFIARARDVLSSVVFILPHQYLSDPARSAPDDQN